MKIRRTNDTNPSNDYLKYKHDALQADSTSHLVDSAESSTSQGHPLPPARSSPTASRTSSYRQASSAMPPLSYHQASSLEGSRPRPPLRSYSPEPDDPDGIPLSASRSRTAPFGSQRSIAESLHSLRSTQQRQVSLPMKKRTDESGPPPVPPPMIPKRDQRTPSPRSFEPKKDSQHLYHNPAHLRAVQQKRVNEQVLDGDVDDDDDELMEQQRMNNVTEDSAVCIWRKQNISFT